MEQDKLAKTEECEKIKEEIKSIIDTLTNKVRALSGTLGKNKERAEEIIKENPVAYTTGAFLGGVVVGYFIGKSR